MNDFKAAIAAALFSPPSCPTSALRGLVTADLSGGSDSGGGNVSTLGERTEHDIGDRRDLVVTEPVEKINLDRSREFREILCEKRNEIPRAKNRSGVVNHRIPVLNILTFESGGNDLDSLCRVVFHLSQSTGGLVGGDFRSHKILGGLGDSLALGSIRKSHCQSGIVRSRVLFKNIQG